MNNHRGPLPDCYCCFHTSHTSSLSASQISPHFVDIILHLSHHHFPSPNFSPTLVARSVVCSPLHTLHQTGRKTRVGFGAETSCSAHSWVWRQTQWREGGENGNDLTKEILARINASSHPSNMLQSQNTVWKLTRTFHSCTFYCSVRVHV